MENEKLFELMTQMYSEMKESFSKFSSDINRLDTKMNQGFSTLNSEIKEVKRTLLHIEQDHGKKLEVIFDGLTQHTEQLNRIEKRLDKHDEIILRRIKWM
jgi:phage-related minor tail protein